MASSLDKLTKNLRDTESQSDIVMKGDIELVKISSELFALLRCNMQKIKTKNLDESVLTNTGAMMKNFI